jgi:hypothetical protein
MGKPFRNSHEKHHQFLMDHLRYIEERDRVLRTINRPDRCPHCGHSLNGEHPQGTFARSSERPK